MNRRSLSLVAFAGVLALGCRPGQTTRFPDRLRPGTPLKLDVERPEAPSGERLAILDLLRQELERNLERLSTDDVEVPAYFLAYDAVAMDQLWLEAQGGAVVKNHRDADRTVDVDVRVGSPQLDNSHGQGGDYSGNGLGAGISLSLADEPLSIAQTLWLVTEQQYRDAIDALSEAESSEVLLTREDELPHPDFSQEEAVVHHEPVVELDLSAVAEKWAGPIAEISAALSNDDWVLEDSVVLQGIVENRSFVNSEGTEVQGAHVRLRLMMNVATQADDGMRIERFRSFDVHMPDQLPSAKEAVAAAETLRKELLMLRDAPVAEPYTGPAVLEGPAAGVFFHEIFGHRLEGHRQKDDLEGQTFTQMLDKQVLPSFLDVVDDPTIQTLSGGPLNGHYFIDDEGVPAQPANLVEKGKLRGFLLGRSPVLPFEHSNGHGRRERGHQVVARQGNLIVSARKTVPEGKLRDQLIAEAKKQDKPYGLWFSDIQGGYTITDRSGPQAFKVLPLMVYRVYADGRPDELVRGVDIVGTPLAAFETIVAAGDEPGVFNGMCGAESGWVPVSAVSPSLLLSKIEIERGFHDRNRPPLLPPPGAAKGGAR